MFFHICLLMGHDCIFQVMLEDTNFVWLPSWKGSPDLSRNERHMHFPARVAPLHDFFLKLKEVMGEYKMCLDTHGPVFECHNFYKYMLLLTSAWRAPYITKKIAR
jgi:hypothetical protein